MALPPPQQGTLCRRITDWWIVVVVFLVVFVPLRSPSAREPPSLTHSDWTDWTEWPDCTEARRWPTFCSTLLNTSILNATAKESVLDLIPKAKAFFCDMIRVLNKIDCAQPFTVSPRWRLGCQEAYRDWSCSLLAEGLLPLGLNSCDSTCHQVIRVCPYLSPDRNQVDASGKASLQPSQYGGHPAFHCPTTYTDSNHHHTEDYFFRRSTPNPHALVCILLNPSEAGLTYSSFPLQSLDLRNLSVTYCQDYGSNHDDPHPLLTDKRGRVNVSQCCWTYNTALPRTYNALSSTLRRRVLEDENCPTVDPNLHEEPPFNPPLDQQTVKHIFLQCLVTQDTSITPTIPGEPTLDFYDIETPLYVDDEPSNVVMASSVDDDDGLPPRFNSAEGEEYDDEDEYDLFPRASSTTEAFLALIASLDSSTTPNNWRQRRSAVTYSPNGTSAAVSRNTVLLVVGVLVTIVLPFCKWLWSWSNVEVLCSEKRDRGKYCPRLGISLVVLKSVGKCKQNTSPECVVCPVGLSPSHDHNVEEHRRRHSPSTPCTTTNNTTTTTTNNNNTIIRISEGRRKEWRRLLWSNSRPCPSSYSLQRIT